jgi:hypothetical protein
VTTATRREPGHSPRERCGRPPEAKRGC